MPVPLRCGPWIVLPLCCLGLGACEKPAAESKPDARKVVVSTPLAEKVVDYAYFNGHMEAVDSVDVAARVSGYLVKIDFESGSEVEKGKLLFKIDDRPYDAAYKRDVADAKGLEAELKRWDAEVARAKQLLPSGSISREEFEQKIASRDATDARLQAARAQIEQADLNLKWTEVRAPIDGRISRNLISAGNLVAADTTLLTTIVSIDPIYAYFNVDERALLEFQRMVREGKVKTVKESKAVVQVATDDDPPDQYPHEGTIDFADNRIEAGTGTLQVRGVFDNAERIFSPGLNIRVRLPISEPRPALLVSERAIGNDQGEKFLLAVDADNKVQRLKVQLGDLHGGLRVIESGLAADQRVIVVGGQRVRPGMLVAPREEPMPRGAAPSAAPAVIVNKVES